MSMEKEKSMQKQKAVCSVCPHHCLLAEGQTGRCRARKNREGKIVSINYGKLTSLMLDPIEKKQIGRASCRERV